MQESTSSTNRLSASGVYTCPVCRHGQISGLPMMENTFACEFCHHLFSANIEQQILKMEDSQIPLSWRWNGRTWKGIHRDGLDLGWGYAVAGIIFVGLPPTLVGLAAYLFPPMPGSPLSWLPLFWTVLTFVVHLACLGWLVIEYYQFPIFAYLRAISRRLVNRNWRRVS